MALKTMTYVTIVKRLVILAPGRKMSTDLSDIQRAIRLSCTLADRNETTDAVFEQPSAAG